MAAICLVAAVIGWVPWRGNRDAPATVSILEINPPEGRHFTPLGDIGGSAISPDGRTLAGIGVLRGLQDEIWVTCHAAFREEVGSTTRGGFLGSVLGDPLTVTTHYLQVEIGDFRRRICEECLIRRQRTPRLVAFALAIVSVVSAIVCWFWFKPSEPVLKQSVSVLSGLLTWAAAGGALSLVSQASAWGPGNPNRQSLVDELVCETNRSRIQKFFDKRPPPESLLREYRVKKGLKADPGPGWHWLVRVRAGPKAGVSPYLDY